MSPVLRFQRVILTLLTCTCSTLALAGAGSLDGARTAAIALPSGWTRITVQGTITVVTPRTGTFLLSIPQRERRTVRVTGGSVVQIKSSFVDDVGELRVGDDVKVWGYAQPDATLLAAHVLVLSRKGGSPLAAITSPASPRSGLHGVVLSTSEDMMTVLTDAGQVKEVLRTAIARVEGDAGPAEPREFDIVRIDGNMLSDGNISATRIMVEFVAATAPRFSGRITAVVPEASMFVLDDASFVNVVPDTFIVQGTVLRALGGLGIGRSVQLLGVSGVVTPFVVKARVVVLTL